MTPEERAAVIMANMATAPCGSDRWKRLCEMVEHQFRACYTAAKREGMEEAAKIVETIEEGWYKVAADAIRRRIIEIEEAGQ